MRAPWRKDFNRHKEFVVRKKIVLDGELLVAGSPFPKERVTTRRLRQLFDTRIIVFADDEAAPELAPKKAKQRAAPEQLEPEIEPAGAVPVEIPADWRKLNAAGKVALALTIDPDCNATTGVTAASVIAEEAKRRAATP